MKAMDCDCGLASLRAATALSRRCVPAVTQPASITALSRPVCASVSMIAPLIAGRPCFGFSGLTVTVLTAVSAGALPVESVAIM